MPCVLRLSVVTCTSCSANSPTALAASACIGLAGRDIGSSLAFCLPTRFAARSPSVLISYAVHTVNAQGQRLAIGWHWQAFSLFPKCCATSSQVHLNHSTVQLNFHLAQKPVFWAYAGLPSKACTRPPYTDLCLLGWSAWQCVRILRLRGLRLFDSFDHPSLCIKLINDI